MKQNILITVYDMEIGGIERSLINMLNSFDYERFNVDLFICEHKGEFMDLIPEEVNVLPAIKQYTIFRKPLKQCLKEGLYVLSVTKILSKYLAVPKARVNKLKEGSGYIQMQLALKYALFFVPSMKAEYDVAISYAWPHDIIAKKVRAKKKIAWIHTDYSQLEVDNKMDLKIWNRFDHIISISDDCTKSFLTTYPELQEKIILIENITSPKLIKEMAEKKMAIKSFNKKSFNILSVGRLSYAKGFDIAILTLKNLHDQGYTNIKWYVIGYGPEEQALKNLIDTYQLKDSFILLGKQTNPYPYMKHADIYVQPSRYEGKAVTVTEAKILGKPILLANYPTAKSQLDDDTEGLICDLSAEGLAKGIETFYQDAELRNQFTDQLKARDFQNKHELKKLYQVIYRQQTEKLDSSLKESVEYEY